jgi:endonuclease III
MEKSCDIKQVNRLVVNGNAYEVMDILVKAQREKQGIYGQAVLPQEYKPDHLRPGGAYFGSHEHVMYFWNICSYMTGRVKSDLAFQTMTRIFNDAVAGNNEQLGLFQVDNLAESEPTKVADILRSYGFGRQELTARQLIENAKKLRAQYDGDPLKIFDGVQSYEECLARIKNDGKGNGFLGFREKMVSMILYFYNDEKLLPEMHFPLPVDFHAIRVAAATKMIDLPEETVRSKALEDTLRDIYGGYSQKMDIRDVELANAVWQLSSGLCNKSPGNLSEMVDGKMLPIQLNEYDFKQGEAFYRACGRCVLKNHCQFFVPSAPYYNYGRIIIRDRQAIWPEQLTLSL